MPTTFAERLGWPTGFAAELLGANAPGILLQTRPYELDLNSRIDSLLMGSNSSTAPNSSGALRFVPPRGWRDASWRAVAAAVAVLSLLVSMPGCVESNAPAKQRRVILIGIDGAAPRVVDELMLNDRLPNLAAIARDGASGSLRSEFPIHSPRIWNTIATGVAPEKHGIITFSYTGRDGKQHLYTSAHRKVPALWSIANAAGLRVGVVNFWNTYPLEKIDGVMVSDHVLAKEIEGRHRMVGAQASGVASVIYPEAWNTKLSTLIESNATLLPGFENPFADGKPLPRWVKRDELKRRFKEDGALASIADAIIRDERPDVMMVLLPGVDRISHYLWGVLEPPDIYGEGVVPTPEGREAGRTALFAYYEYADSLVGKLTEHYGPDDLVMVISDHGFEGEQALFRLTGNHTTEKAINGVIFARGHGIEPGSKAIRANVRDITPTILTWLGLPVAKDMTGVTLSFLTLDPETIPPRVASYNDLPIEFLDAEPLPSGVEGDIVEQLKSLGYIDEP